MLVVEVIGEKIVSGRLSGKYIAYPGKLIDAILTEEEKNTKVENWIVNPCVYTISFVSTRPHEVKDIVAAIFRSVAV